MDKKTRELLEKLTTSQLKQLAEEKGIDCGESPDRTDFLSILGKSDKIRKKDVQHLIKDMEDRSKEGVSGEEYFGEIEKVLKDQKGDGALFEEGIELLKTMQSNIREGNLEDTISMGVAGSGMIEDLSIKFEMVRRAYVIFAFRQLVTDVKESGLDMTDAEKLVLLAAEHFHSGATEELDGVLNEISSKAKELQTEQAKKLKETIKEVEEFIDQSLDLGVEMEEARDLVKKAQEAFEAKAFKKVTYYTSKARKSAEEARENRIKGLSDALLFVQSILEDTRDIGADVSEVEKIYADAKAAFDEGKYPRCKTLIKEVEQTALELQDSQIKKAMALKKKRQPEEVEAEVVEVNADAGKPPHKRRGARTYPPSSASRRYDQGPPIPPGMKKTRCPNCGQGFPVKAQAGPQRIECPFCGMRGMMP